MARTMLNLGEEDDESYLGGDDESYLGGDDEAYLEAYDEAVRPFRGTLPGARSYRAPGPGTKGGQMKLPTGGTAQIQFSKAMVSKEEFDKALELVRQDIKKESAAIATLDKRASSDIKSLRSKMDNSSMMSLLPMFMQPKLSSITFASPGPSPGTPLPVTASLQADGMMPLMLMMMMGGGGFMGMGSSEKGGGTQDMMMMLLVLAMSGKL